MQNRNLILAVLMVFYISVVNCSSVFADAREDILNAVCRGASEQVELWFEKNADLITSGNGGEILFTARDKEGWTAVICAAANNDLKSSELLIKAGAEVNVKDNLGWSPLMYAADVKYGVKMVSFLLDNGADPNVRNNDGETPLSMAVSGKNLPTIKLLVEKGADIHATDPSGRSVLIIAVVNGNSEIVSYLLNKGAKIEAKDDKGLTALNHATIGKQTDTAILLVKKGARLDDKSARYFLENDIDLKKLK